MWCRTIGVKFKGLGLPPTRVCCVITMSKSTLDYYTTCTNTRLTTMSRLIGMGIVVGRGGSIGYPV